MKTLTRWTALATALQLILITAVAHSDPKPRNSQPKSPQGCTSKNVALFASPTPSCGSTLQAIVGSQFTLSVKAGDADAGDVVQLGVTGLPAGAKLSTALPASGNPVSTNLTWTPAAGDTGSHVVTFTAWDGCAAGPTQCSFTVNVHASGSCTSTNVALFESPTPSCGSTLQATAGAPFTLSVKAGDADAGDVVQLGVIGLPAGAKLSTGLPASGNPVATSLTWTPAAGDTGTHVITFTAYDGCAAGPTQCSFTVNVNPSGACSSTSVALFQSPTPSCGSTLQATAGTAFNLSVNAGDADAGDVVQLGVIGLPAGAKLSTALPASGNPVSTNLIWTPAAGDTGTHVITFTASDGCAAGPTQCSFTVHVNPSGACSSTNVALFQSPTPSCGSTLNATAGSPFTLSVKAGDADAGDVVQLGVVGLPAGAQLSTALPASGNPVSTDLTWTPAAGDTGMHVITFTAYDGCAAGPTQCSFTVHVGSSGGGGCTPTNVALFQSPTPSCGSTLDATVGSQFTLSVKAGDADNGDIVQLGIIGLPSGAQLSTPLPASGNPVSTNLTWTPVAGDVGSHVITFTAWDSCAAGPTQCSFTVNVGSGGGGCTPANVALFQSPTPSCGSSLNATVGSPFTLSVKAGDADKGDVVQLGIIGLPAGAQLSTPLPASGNPVSTNLTWTPVAGDVGSHVITFTAWDSCAAGPTQCSFTVNVGSGGGCTPTNVALFQSPTPSCGSSRQATVGSPVTFTVKAGDADAGDVVQLAVIGLPAGATLSTPLPASGNPVSTDFTWTPTASDVGSHVITFTAFDNCAAGPTQCSFTVNVGQGGGGNPPDCSAAYVADSEIWPPNGRMVPIHVQGINDPDGDSFTVHVTNVTSDESMGSGDAACDGNGNMSVRARRDGNGNGRVYHVTFLATDANGNSCEGSVELCVPHDQGRHNECVDDGQNFRVEGDCDDDDDVNGSSNGAAKATNKDAIDLKVTQVSGGVAQVEYTLPAEARMTLSVYNVAGRRIATIAEGIQPAGTRSARWVPTNPMPTVYFVQLRSGDKSVVKRIFFLNR